MTIYKKEFAEADNSWSIILGPVRGELAKTRAVHKISEAFSVSEEEACSLIDNAPIVLLEDLSYDSARKIKVYFEGNDLSVQFSNNPLEKRKCFRTVWPEVPRLSFAMETPVRDSTSKGVDREVLSAGDAIAHIREEIMNGNASEPTEGRPGTDGNVTRKYEALGREYSLLAEDKMIQDQKLEALDKEVRFLRDKEGATTAQLKTALVERENLMHELEAVKIKNELMKGELESRDSKVKTRLAEMEVENQALRERMDSLGREYEEAEKVWVARYRKKEEDTKPIEAEAADLRAKMMGLSAKVAEADEFRKRAVSEEVLRLREQALKELVKRQEWLAREIMEKEKLLKTVLSEQERMEQEILKTRHLGSA